MDKNEICKEQSQAPMGILPVSRIRAVSLVKEFNLLSVMEVFALPAKWVLQSL